MRLCASLNAAGTYSSLKALCCCACVFRMGRIYRFLGLSCQSVNDSSSLSLRRKVFGSVDIVYLTARTLGFSYLGHLTAQAPDEEVHTPCSYNEVADKNPPP